MVTNQFGLSRHIPENIKQEVRRRSKFGCVNCRCAIYQYEHIEPEFREAKKHNPDNMCLLCGHCHDKVTRGILSKETIKKQYRFVQESDDIKRPFDEFDLNHHNINITLGSCVFYLAKKLIVLNGIDVLTIEPPEQGSHFPVLSGYFTDELGNELFRIDRNEWVGSTDAWDFTIQGREITIQADKNRVALQLEVIPPHTIKIIQLDLRIGDAHLICKENLFSIGRISPEAEYYLTIDALECWGADIGVLVNKEGIQFPPKADIFRMVGGEGIEFCGTGIKVAVGSGKMLISGITLEYANKIKTVTAYIHCQPGNMQVDWKITPPRLQ